MASVQTKFLFAVVLTLKHNLSSVYLLSPSNSSTTANHWKQTSTKSPERTRRKKYLQNCSASKTKLKPRNHKFRVNLIGWVLKLTIKKLHQSQTPHFRVVRLLPWKNPNKSMVLPVSMAVNPRKMKMKLKGNPSIFWTTLALKVEKLKTMQLLMVERWSRIISPWI